MTTALNYDSNKLIQNLQCLGCDKFMEVKTFLNHTDKCRLANCVPEFRNA